jgi:tryptophan synthase beta chain
VAWVVQAARAGELAGRTVVVNLSGRGDKDVAQVAEILGDRYPR